jgi:hypothetical protein
MLPGTGSREIVTNAATAADTPQRERLRKPQKLSIIFELAGGGRQQDKGAAGDKKVGSCP